MSLETTIMWRRSSGIAAVQALVASTTFSATTAAAGVRSAGGRPRTNSSTGVLLEDPHALLDGDPAQTPRQQRRLDGRGRLARRRRRR